MANKKTVSFTKNTTNVFLHILTRCNLKCRHCYINPNQHGKNDLTVDAIEKWLSLFNKKEANLVILGGEPTMHPELPAVVRIARRLGYGSITIDTNGYVFHNFLEKISPDEIDYISFSLDGATRETNDSIRGAGCFDSCISGLKKAVSAGFTTSLIYTVSSENIHELPQMVSFVPNLGISRFFIQVIGIRGKSAEKGEKLQLTRELWLDTIPEAAERIAEYGIKVVYPKVFLRLDERFECAGKESVADNYFIFPNGRVYRCPLCEDYPIHSLEIVDNRLVKTPRINENDLFCLEIPEGCVMNKLVQPDNIDYDADGNPTYKIACCMLKEEVG